MGMQLFNYFRSSASYRVRIALALKGLDYDYMPVHLQRKEQFSESYAQVSAARLVPTLVDDGAVLTQSLAIIEYLDETHPTPPLLPSDPIGRARVRTSAKPQVRTSAKLSAASAGLEADFPRKQSSSGKQSGVVSNRPRTM